MNSLVLLFFFSANRGCKKLLRTPRSYWFYTTQDPGESITVCYNAQYLHNSFYQQIPFGKAWNAVLREIKNFPSIIYDACIVPTCAVWLFACMSLKVFYELNEQLHGCHLCMGNFPRYIVGEKIKSASNSNGIEFGPE